MTETKIKEESSNEGVATEMAQKKTDGLLKKLVEITAKVERIPKNGWNDRQKYHYALESDIKDVVRKEMSERGLVLVPSELNRVVSVINTKSGGQQQIVSLEIDTPSTMLKQARKSHFVDMVMDKTLVIKQCIRQKQEP
jgi:ABC-type uncharacterized transport system ATPase component